MKYLNRGNLVCQEDPPDDKDDIRDEKDAREFYTEMRVDDEKEICSLIDKTIENIDKLREVFKEL